MGQGKHQRQQLVQCCGKYSVICGVEATFLLSEQFDGLAHLDWKKASSLNIPRAQRCLGWTGVLMIRYCDGGRCTELIGFLHTGGCNSHPVSDIGHVASQGMWVVSLSGNDDLRGSHTRSACTKNSACTDSSGAQGCQSTSIQLRCRYTLLS